MGSHSRLLDAVEESVATGVALGIGLLQSEDEQLDGRHVQLRGQRVLSFSSCSYLELELDPRLIEATVDAVRRYGTQFSASRTYISAPAYEKFEAMLEQILGGPVLTAPSTTLAHLTTLPVLVGERDAVLLDQKVHESVQVAASLLSAQGTHLEQVRHSRVDMIESRVRDLASRCERIWYCCDGVYSMRGDFAPIPELLELRTSVARSCTRRDPIRPPGVAASLFVGKRASEGIWRICEGAKPQVSIRLPLIRAEGPVRRCANHQERPSPDHARRTRSPRGPA
jgi:7-keto-8-aminopelargonate synthetase-like enzyme